MSAEQHKCFTVDPTSYLRNLDGDDLREPCIAIHYQAPPRDNGNGTRSISLRVPMMVMSLYLGDQQGVAEKVARILEKHWNDEM